MSSLSNDPVMLRLEGQTAMTKITVTDADFNDVDLPTNAGTVEIPVTPGVYKVAFHDGDAVDIQLATVMPNDEKTVVTQEHPPRFTSSQPLTSVEDDDSLLADTDQINQLIGAIDSTTGSARLLVFVRDLGDRQNAYATTPTSDLTSQTARKYRPSRAERGALNAANPMLGLSIHDATGEPADAHVEIWADHRSGGLGLALGPGVHRLRLVTEVGPVLEMPVTMIAGMRTEVFLLCRQYGRDPGNRRIDLDSATVCLRWPDTPYEPGDRVRRLNELALSALRAGQTLRGGQLDEILRDKFEDPMLGIYGAHLLLMQDDPDPEINELIETVITNTEVALSGEPHPDLAAVALASGHSSEHDVTFLEPPSLTASWTAVIKASRTRHDLVPEGSLTDRVADRIGGGMPWLIWNGPPELDDDAADDDVSGNPAIDEVIANLDEDMVKQIFESSSSPVQAGERAVVQQITQSLKQHQTVGVSKVEDGIDLDAISERLDLPPTSVKRIAHRAQKRFGGRDWS
ncbi:MAG: hypothetical protein GY708_07515 [Actinomycetia bacterium]|nr:hypothetical protein [Actinomycetes bacterium]